MKKITKFPSELRFDLVSKDWVVIAISRGKKIEQYKQKKRAEKRISKKKCPFCNIKSQREPVLIYSQGEKVSDAKDGKIPKCKCHQNWTTIVVPNKYPALLPYSNLGEKTEGNLYRTIKAVGFCELIITKDHKKHFPHFEISKVKEVFDVYQQRYLDLMKKRFVNYVFIFCNYGEEAGASQPHPHSQIITTPLIDVDLQKALLNSERYFRKKKKCIYCQMSSWETKVKKRIVFENEQFLVICPFASKTAFQIIVSPKKHLSYFEKITEQEKWQLAEAFQVAFRKLEQALGDFAYNFYLHTAPCDGKDYSYYHWHWTILPKTAIWAGFEIGTKMEISTIEPEKAAEYLKKIKV